MLTAFHDKINNTPLLYFLLGWGWDKLFGSSELSLRMFSSVGMGIALLIVWTTLRRTYAFWATSIGTLGVFCTSQLILEQNAEARMYGLFLALCAGAFYMYDSFSRTTVSSRKMLLLNACIHIAIVHTHLFGSFYSAAVLVAIISVDKYYQLYRPNIYFSIVISWLSIIFYIPSFLIQSDAGNPRSWILTPALAHLTDFLSLSNSSLLELPILTFLIFIACLQFVFEDIPKERELSAKLYHPSRRQEIYLLVFAFVYLLVPVFIWIVSRVIRPLYWDRYFIPSTLAWTVFLAFLTSRIISVPISAKTYKNRLTGFDFAKSLAVIIVLIALLSHILYHPISYAKIYNKQELPGLQDDTYGYNNLPVVIQFSHKFFTRFHYSSVRDRYYFILDWEVAIDENSGSFSTQEYKHLDAIRRNYSHIFSKNVLSTEEFLKRYNRFLVLDYIDYTQKCPSSYHCPQWVEKRLLEDGNYHVEHLRNIGGDALLLVEKTK
jgi:hypothetical protein